MFSISYASHSVRLVFGTRKDKEKRMLEAISGLLTAFAYCETSDEKRMVVLSAPCPGEAIMAARELHLQPTSWNRRMVLAGEAWRRGYRVVHGWDEE